MFGFPSLKEDYRENIKRNFLRTVVFQFIFEPNKLLKENQSKIFSIFEEKYKRLNVNIGTNFDVTIQGNENPIVKTEKGKGFVIKTQDGDFSINFLEDRIDISIKGQSYKNFNDVLNFEIAKLEKVFEMCQITDLKRIAIRKINIISVKIPENNDLSQISSELLRDEVSCTLNNFPFHEGINKNINNVNYVSGDYQLNLIHGYSTLPGVQGLGHIVIDLDLFNKGEVQIDKLSEVLTKINSEIFNIFIWFLSEASIKLLKNE